MDARYRQKARAHLVRAKTFRLVGILFALVGIGIFAILYLKLADGNFLAAMMDPFLIGVVAFPFIPAFILTMLGKSSENKVIEVIEEAKQEELKASRTDLFSRDKIESSDKDKK